jgi:hypothetical protein
MGIERRFTDEELMGLIKNGDRDAFSELVCVCESTTASRTGCFRAGEAGTWCRIFPYIVDEPGELG